MKKNGGKRKESLKYTSKNTEEKKIKEVYYLYRKIVK